MDDTHKVADRAQREVAARWSSHTVRDRRRVLLGGVLLLIGLMLVPPDPAFVRTNDWLMSGVSGMRPAHAFVVGGLQLPLEARTTGIYAGITLTWLWLAGTARLGAAQLAPRRVQLVLVLMCAVMIGDGVNSTLATLGGAHLYAASNTTRITTGLLAGVSLGCVLAWLVPVVAGLDTHHPVLLTGVRSLIGPIVLSGGYGLVVAQQPSRGYLPIALLSSLGVWIALTSSVLLVMFHGGGWRAPRPRQLLVPTLLACGAACGFLVLAALLRARAGGG